LLFVLTIKPIQLKKINLFWLLLGIAFNSCRSPHDLQGVYTIEKNDILGIQLSLNEDNTFVEYVHPAECEPKWFFGFYQKKGTKLHLNLISNNLGHLRKKDTIIYNKSAIIKDKRIYILYNQVRPLDIAQLYIEGNKFIGDVDKNGVFVIPAGLTFDSLLIRTNVFKQHDFKIKKQDYNQLFIMLYDYTFEECANFSFKTDFEINKKRLHFISNKGKKIYLVQTKG
jgi:hypothetical protein